MGKPLFEVYESKDRLHRWRLKAGNGEKVAASEGYSSREGAKRSVRNIKALAPDADIEEIN